MVVYPRVEERVFDLGLVRSVAAIRVFSLDSFRDREIENYPPRQFSLMLLAD